jgi:hypothetical protein
MSVKKRYQPPTLVTYGPIGDHTFNNPGVGDKSGNPLFELDSFGEFSHPAS